MKKWDVKDVIMVGIISLVFGAIYLGAVYLSSLVLKPIFASIGLEPFAFEIVFGVWFMASTLAAYIMQKAGVAFVSEVIAAIIEMFMGSFYGALVIVSGLVQGAGAELGYAAFKYKKYSFPAMCLASILAAIFSFIWGLMQTNYFALYPAYYVFAMLAVRVASGIFFSAVLVKIIGDGLNRSGVLSSYPIAKK